MRDCALLLTRPPARGWCSVAGGDTVDDLPAAIQLAVAALREMADEAGIARDRADTMAADLALHMMRLARGRPVAKLADSAPPRRARYRYRMRQPPRSE